VRIRERVVGSAPSLRTAVEPGLLHRPNRVTVLTDPIKRHQVRDPVANVGDVQLQLGDQFVDSLSWCDTKSAV
jgi:hypothetical protein